MYLVKNLNTREFEHGLNRSKPKTSGKSQDIPVDPPPTTPPPVEPPPVDIPEIPTVPDTPELSVEPEPEPCFTESSTETTTQDVNTVNSPPIRRRINFVPGQPQFASPNDQQIVRNISNLVRNRRNTINPPAIIQNIDGGCLRTTNQTITTNIRTTVTVNLWTDRGPDATVLLNNRYATIRNTLIASGVPPNSVRLGMLRFNVPHAEMNGNVNLTVFRINTRTTTTTTTRQTTRCQVPCD